mmetsp:Transcript_32485/g.58111  ORF Transcript_32485/g.58111 Transcript_32485/m.58111 type:complete len:235 (-) Transcript_32485:1587-2291(-)
MMHCSNKPSYEPSTESMTSTLGGPSRALELSCGIHSRSVIFPKREAPSPGQTASLSPSQAGMSIATKQNLLNMSTYFLRDMFLLLSPVSLDRLTRSDTGHGASRASQPPNGQSTSATQTANREFVHFQPGLYHGIHAPSIFNDKALKTSTRQSVYPDFSRRRAQSAGEQQPGQRHTRVRNWRQHEIAREATKCRLPSSSEFYSDPAGLPYLKEAEATNNLFQRLQNGYARARAG